MCTVSFIEADESFPAPEEQGISSATAIFASPRQPPTHFLGPRFEARPLLPFLPSSRRPNSIVSLVNHPTQLGAHFPPRGPAFGKDPKDADLSIRDESVALRKDAPMPSQGAESGGPDQFHYFLPPSLGCSSYKRRASVLEPAPSCKRLVGLAIGSSQDWT